MSKQPSYAEQLRHPNWQKKRLEILSRDDFHCQLCFDGESPLHVHHKRYIKGRKPWEYDSRDLVTVCENCHGYADAIRMESAEVMAALHLDGPGSSPEAMCLVAGWGAFHGIDGFQRFAEIGRLPFAGGIIAASMQRKSRGQADRILRIAQLLYFADDETVDRVLSCMLTELEKD